MNKLCFSFFIFLSFVGSLCAAKYPTIKISCEGASYAVHEDVNSNIIAVGNYGISVLKNGRFHPLRAQEQRFDIVTSESNAIYAANEKSIVKILGDTVSVLSNDLPPEIASSTVRNLIHSNSGVYAHMANRIIKISGDMLDYNFTDVTFAGVINKGLVIQRYNQGLFLLAANKFRKINESEIYSSEPLLDILSLKDGKCLLIYQDNAVVYDGDNFVPWEAQGIQWIKKLRIKHAVSNNEGVFLCDDNNAIYQLSEAGELIRLNVPGTVINDLYVDQVGNIWIASEEAIFILNTSSAFRLLPLEGTPGKSLNFVDDELYIGSESGLLKSTLLSFVNDGLPKKINNSPVHDIVSDKGQCFIATESGLWHKNEFAVRKINDGYKSYTGVLVSDENIFIEASDSGLNLYQLEYGRWEFLNHLYGIEEEVIQIVKDEDGLLWSFQTGGSVASLKYDPVLNTINPTVYEVENANGIFLINGRLVVTAYSGIFEFDPRTDRFVKSENYEELLGSDSDIQELFQDEDENIWYISSKEVGVLIVDDLGVKKSIKKRIVHGVRRYLNNKEPYISSLNEEGIVLGARDGFVLLQPDNLTNKEFVVHLFESEAYNKNEKQLEHRFYLDKSNPVLKLNKKTKQVRLVFDASYSTFDENVLYSYNVNDEGWSEKSAENILNTELPGGTNNIKVRAHYGINMTSNTLVIPIFIHQDWYMIEMNQYLIIGALALLMLIILFLLWRTAKARKKQVQALEKNILKNQSEISVLRDKNEILSAQLISAMNDNDISQQLEKLQQDHNDPEVKKAIKKLVKKLKTTNTPITNSLTPDPEFIARLKLRYPQLTKKDIRLCSLLKMDLTTKDIAPILDITVRGVEISRYRLRKKLELENEVVLSDFLKQV